MKVLFLDLRAAYIELKDEIDAAVARVLDSGWYIAGPEVEAFEHEFAAYCETSYAVGAANGLDALVLALRSLDIGTGDEVIVPSNTFIASWLSISQVGAKPVPVEPDVRTFNIDTQRLEAALSSRTKAVMAVHLYGQPADLDPIVGFARKHGIAVVEDAAQAHGARYKGRRIGSHGDIVCWSFYPGKNLGAMGDGGAITTARKDLADRVRLLGNYGSRQKYLHEEKGLNSRLDPLQAAVLRVKLRYLDDWNDRRRLIAQRYLDALAGADMTVPHVPHWAEPVWHLFVVRTQDRDSWKERLQLAGVSTLIHYPVAAHEQTAYAEPGLCSGRLPVASSIAKEVLSLPIGPQMSLEAVDHVAGVITGIFGR